MYRLIFHEVVREEILSLPAGVKAKLNRLALKRQQEMLDTSTRYALACGVKHPQIMLY